DNRDCQYLNLWYLWSHITESILPTPLYWAFTTLWWISRVRLFTCSDRLTNLLGYVGVLPEQRKRALGELLAVAGVSIRPGFVPFRLACLRQQDQRSRVSGLEAEGEVQQDERVGI